MAEPWQIYIDQCLKVAEQDFSALQAIASGEPDSKLGPDLDVFVPRLLKRKLIQVCDCSDGDYVVLTEAGRRALHG